VNTEEPPVGEQCVGGNDHSFTALEGDDCSSGDDGAGEMSDGIVFWHLSLHLNIF